MPEPGREDDAFDAAWAAREDGFEDDAFEDEDWGDPAPPPAPAGDAETWTVTDDEVGLSVLQLLGDRLHDVPTSQLRDLVRYEGALWNDRPTGINQTLSAGDTLTVYPAGLERIRPRKLKGFLVVHEDDDLLVVDKPAGVAVEAERGDDARPFKAAILHHLRGAQLRPRLVHRLDRETSGLLLVAKHRRALVHLTRQFEQREVEKEYVALVKGRPADDEPAGEIDRPLAPRSKRGRGKVEDAKPARSRWECVESFRHHAFVRVFPLTGRQHQVRQHLALLGWPIVGDGLYGDGKPLLLSALKPGDYNTRKGREEKPLMGRMALHARRLVFLNLAGARVEVEAELPKDLRTSLARLRKYDAR